MPTRNSRCTAPRARAFKRTGSGRGCRRGAGLCPVGQTRAALPTRAQARLIEGIDCQSAEKLGVEVGGFLGHDFAGKRNVSDLRHTAGVHEENNVGTRAPL